MIEQLAKSNLSVRDRKAVYLTHLDIDHAGGLQEGKDVKDIYCSEAEKEAAFKGGARYKLWRKTHRLARGMKDIFLCKTAVRYLAYA